MKRFASAAGAWHGLKAVLCLVVGLLVFAWRAVPVLAWNPSTCAGYDCTATHWMSTNCDIGYWQCYRVCGYPLDNTWLEAWKTPDQKWVPAVEHDTYVCTQYFRISTYGDPSPGKNGHMAPLDFKFTAYICACLHASHVSGTYAFTPGCWTPVRYFYGCSLGMTRGAV